MHNSNQINKLKVCRVCGLYFENFFPWGENGDISSHEICTCCGTEWGYEDSNYDSIKIQRQKWVNTGMQWKLNDKFSLKLKPKNWNPEEQLENIPEEYK